MQSNRNFYLLLMGMKNETATLKRSLVVSYKTKHSLNHIVHQSHF